MKTYCGGMTTTDGGNYFICKPEDSQCTACECNDLQKHASQLEQALCKLADWNWKNRGKCPMELLDAAHTALGEYRDRN